MRGAEERLLLETKALHTHQKGGEKVSGKNQYSRSKIRFEHIGVLELPTKLLLYFLRSAANPIWDDIFVKAQSSKLESLFSLKRGKRDVRTLIFEL